jgi:DNA (cytosine-5)-methyltransferase 1
VFDVGKRNLRRVDVVVGGFPCQPVSAAGKQRGADDVRWLWPEFVRVVREIKPRWVVVENVVRLLSVNAGREFGGVVRDLAACGFCVEWDCLPAAAVGAPHIRDRVFVVAYAEQMGRGAGRGIASDERRTRVGRREFARGGQDLESATGRERVGWWTTESGLDRVAYGVSGRVDRLKGLGNAVVPQVAQWIGEHIVGANE